MEEDVVEIDKQDDRSYILVMGRKPNHALKQQLLDVGTVAFRLNGFAATGIKEIVDQAGVPKGSFYSYFSSKEDFAAEVILQAGLQVSEQFEQVAAQFPDDVKEQFKAFFGLMAEQLRDNSFQGGCLVGNLSAEVAETSERCRRAAQVVMAGWRKGITHRLLEAQKNGQIRSSNDAEATAELILNSWEGTQLRMKIERSIRPFETFRDQLLDNL